MREPVDLERLREFSVGTAQGLRTLTRLFLDEVGEAAIALARAVDGGALVDVEVIAHRAAGTAGACGAAVLASVLSKMESAAHSHDTEVAAALIVKAVRTSLGARS